MGCFGGCIVGDHGSDYRSGVIGGDHQFAVDTDRRIHKRPQSRIRINACRQGRGNIGDGKPDGVRRGRILHFDVIYGYRVNGVVGGRFQGYGIDLGDDNLDRAIGRSANGNDRRASQFTPICAKIVADDRETNRRVFDAANLVVSGHRNRIGGSLLAGKFNFLELLVDQGIELDSDGVGGAFGLLGGVRFSLCKVGVINSRIGS